jgi:hypothetical protein
MHLPPAFLLHAAASKLGPGRWREARRGTATCSVDPGCRCRDGTGWDQLGGAARAPASGFELFQRSLAGRMPCQRRQTGTACAAPQFVGRLYWQVGLPGNFLYSKQSELVNLTTPLTLCLNLN